MPPLFVRGQTYNRRQHIHAPYGGQQQGGIITPAQHPLVICITGKSGEQHGYADGWTADGTFAYFGEGQVGDMEFKGGNSAILEHSEAGEDLLLFEKQADGALRYEGEFICAGYHRADAPDRNGDIREAIVFDLVPTNTEAGPGDAIDELPATEQSLDDLRAAALAAVQPAREPTRSTARTVHQRSAVIRRYVLARANGKCELCETDAPFVTTKGEPYLEPHHIRRLSDGGPDDPRYMAALCPNCHRNVHLGEDGPALNEKALQRVQAIEQSS